MSFLGIQMARYSCYVCGHVHDEEARIIKWAELPEKWNCPVCDSDKNSFRRIGDDNVQD
jgi:rubredoxin